MFRSWFPRTWALRTLAVFLLPVPLLLLATLERIAGFSHSLTITHLVCLMMLMLPGVTHYRRIEDLARHTEGRLRGVRWVIPQGLPARAALLAGLAILTVELTLIVNHSIASYPLWVRLALVGWVVGVAGGHLATVWRHQQRRVLLPTPDLWTSARLRSLYTRLSDRLGSRAAARDWLQTPRSELAGRTAFVAAWTDEGMRAVEALLESSAVPVSA